MQNRSSIKQQPPTRLPWILIGVFLILLIAVIFARISAAEQTRSVAELATYERLNSIAGLKEEQLSAWLAEREHTAQGFARTASISTEIISYIQEPTDTAMHGTLQEWLTIIHETYKYKEVILAGLDGQTILSWPETVEPLPAFAGGFLDRAVSSQKLVSTGLYLDPVGKVALDYFAPVLLPSSTENQAIAVLIFRIDPEAELLPLVNAWPGSTSTSEVLLVQQDGQEVVLLNQPSLSTNRPLGLRLSISDGSTATTQAVKFRNGTGSGTDYRGVPVFFSYRQIPGSDWILIAKIDQAEIFEPLREQDNLASLLTVSLFLAAMLTAVLITRQREVQYYKELYLAEVNRQALSEHLVFISRYANDIILLTDDHLTILEANDRAITAYGYSLEQLRQLNFYQLSDEQSRDDLAHEIKTLNLLGGLVFEGVHLRSDGSTFPVECSTRIIEVEEKKFYQSIIRDITERKLAEEMLRQSERRFRLFYEQAPISYQSLDQDGCFTDVNEAWQQAFGYSRKEVVGRSFADLLSEGSHGRWFHAMQEFRESGDLHGCEVEVRCAKGERVIVSITGKVSYDEHHQVQLLHCVLNDVTEQRLAAAQIQRMNEELEKRVLDRTAQLEAANKELEAFSYSVSHDLRAPLRAIDGFTRIVIDEYGPGIQEDASRYLNLVRENAHTMSSLIDNLLTFSRLSRHPLKKQHIDLNELVNEVLQTISPGPDCRQISYILHPLPACDADPLLLKQVLINLLSNAIKFTGKIPSAVIEVGCLQEGEETIYYIKDNGVGFDMQYAPKLFGVFQRLHRVEDYEGTGVGLAIVQRIIHRHGGRVWAMGEINQGATFCFTLEIANHHD